MLKCLITPGAYTSGNIPITVLKNTNANYTVANNAISIESAGITDVKANIIFTATSTDAVTAQLYADGTAVPGALATITPVSGSTYTLHINDVVKTILAIANFATLTIQLSEACTLVGGDVICEYVR